jgi:hypothetical protein
MNQLFFYSNRLQVLNSLLITFVIAFLLMFLSIKSIAKNKQNWQKKGHYEFVSKSSSKHSSKIKSSIKKKINCKIDTGQANKISLIASKDSIFFTSIDTLNVSINKLSQSDATIQKTKSSKLRRNKTIYELPKSSYDSSKIQRTLVVRKNADYSLEQMKMDQKMGKKLFLNSVISLWLVIQMFLAYYFLPILFGISLLGLPILLFLCYKNLKIENRILRHNTWQSIFGLILNVALFVFYLVEIFYQSIIWFWNSGYSIFFG